MVANNPHPIWKIVKTCLVLLAIAILGILGTIAALVGTCAVIITAFSGGGSNTMNTAFFGIVLEGVAALLLWAIYLMVKSQFK